MKTTSHISIDAWVTDGERSVVEAAAGFLARAVSAGATVPWTCTCSYSPKPEIKGAILLTSLLPELNRISDPWPETESRLRASYRQRGESGRPVFICTILRHVASDEPFSKRNALLVRIRQLNFLAAEISRESGAFVIDLDRVLADIGAMRFDTDYRLGGATAAEMAAHFMAMTIVANGLDDIVSYEIQDGAKAALAASRPPVPGYDFARADFTLSRGVEAIGQGRRRQTVSLLSQATEDGHAGWMVRQVLRGSISPGDAMQRMVSAIRRRGLRESAGLLATGLIRQLNRKA